MYGWTVSSSGHSGTVGGSCGFGLEYIEQLESKYVVLPCSRKHGCLTLSFGFTGNFVEVPI